MTSTTNHQSLVVVTKCKVTITSNHSRLVVSSCFSKVPDQPNETCKEKGENNIEVEELPGPSMSGSGRFQTDIDKEFLSSASQSQKSESSQSSHKDNFGPILTAEEKRLIISLGPNQPRGPFPKDREGRMYTEPMTKNGIIKDMKNGIKDIEITMSLVILFSKTKYVVLSSLLGL